MEVLFLGTGDAFCSGGRNQTCIMVQHEQYRLLLDCGATSLKAMKSEGVATESISTIVITHFHGDHFGGLPYLLLEGHYIENRRHPLTIVGPPGIAQRVLDLTQQVYPGVDVKDFSYALEFIEFQEQIIETGPVTLSTWPVVHAPESLPHAVKLGLGGKKLAFSGDTGWTNNLYDVAAKADLFVCECNFYHTMLPTHLSYKTIEQERSGFDCERIILNHLGPEMLVNLDKCSLPLAHDGLKIVL